MTRVAELVRGGTPVTVRQWCRQTDIDADIDAQPSITSEDSGEVRRRTRENAEFKRAHAIPEVLT